MNKYLEKISAIEKSAGLYGSAHRFVREVTGSRVRELERNLAKLPAESPMLRGINSPRHRMKTTLDYARQDRRKARIGLAAGYGAKVAVGAGLYSVYKKQKADNKNAE